MNSAMFRDILGARPKALGFLIFLGVLCIALICYLSLYQRPQLERIQGEWSAKKEQLRNKPTGTAAAYQRDQRDLAEFQKRYIPKREFAAFLSKMYETAQNNALKLSSVSFKPTPLPGQGLVSYGISFTASGKYAGLKSFISDLSRFQEMVTVDSVSLNNRSQTSEEVDLKINVTAYLKTEGA